jgi:hypothetical protein
MTDRFKIQGAWTVFVLFFVSALLSSLIYSEVFFTFKTSFILWYDYVVEYFMTFILTTYFYQGGIQLWDVYGQMPMDFNFVTMGMFKFQNIVTAILFYIFAPFADHTGEMYHRVFAWGNLMSHLFLRVAGIFLLLQCFTKNKWVIAIGTVLFAVFFSQPAFLWGTFMLSFFPLLLYFTIRFVKEFRWRYLIGLMLMYVIVAGNGLIYLGATHLGMHFFILSCIAWVACFNRQGFKRFLSDCNKSCVEKHIRVIILLAFAIIIVVGPYLCMLSQGLNDVSFGASESRISQPFNPDFYFKKLSLGLADSKNFIAHTLNFMEYDKPMLFFGWMIYIFALVGIVFSRNTLKWVFGLSIVFLWLINHPRQELSIGLIGHWINALTNPLKSIPRSYLVASYTIMSYLLMPLAVLGIESLISMHREKTWDVRRWSIFLSAILIFAIFGTLALPQVVRNQLLFSALILSAAVVWALFKSTLSARRILVVVLTFFTLVDISLVIYQSKKRFGTDCLRKPAVFETLATHGAIDYDAQNPMIMPWREYAMNEYTGVDGLILWPLPGLTSNYYHTINHALNFEKPDGHFPRHAAFDSWTSKDNLSMHVYLDQNKRILSRMPQAVAASDDAFEELGGRGVLADVAVIEDPSGRLNLPANVSDIQKKSDESIRFNEVSGLTSDWVKGFTYRTSGDLILFSFKLPPDFPTHLATTWFTEDTKYLRFSAEHPQKGWIEFTHSQGPLIKPYTFDVQNIHAGRLTAAFPKNDFYAGKFKFLYAVDKNEGVIRVWRKEHDDLGLTYRAAGDGWCVLHFPYTKKWRIIVDGKPVAYYKANKSFIGFPIKAGDHKILIQYRPGSFLRIALLWSAVVTTVGLIVLIFMAFGWEKKRKNL